ncbi:MAG TPA: 4Fe-4S dicluster domain-containing protein [Meiothermus sp.]|nr:4Fe-4S dicluster domain-containing protein [Meiothermus sp.]
MTAAKQGLERQRYQQGEYALLVRRPWCKGCNICVEACPQHILALDAHEKVYVTDIGQCIFCGLCAVRCPDFVFVLERPNTLPQSGVVKL